MKVVVLMGGRSAEREISIKSGQAVLKALQELGYEAIALDLTEDLCEKLREIEPDRVFIALHGPYGEDGRLQGFLDILGIPYVGSGVLGSSIAMDKDITKKVLAFHGIRVPKWVCVRDEKEELNWDSYPAVVKPADQGSSIGLFVVRNQKETKEAITKCFEFSKKVMVEEYIEGKDITVGILKERALPPIEIIPKKGVYDYESKYTKGMTEYTFLEDERLTKELQEIALLAHRSLELKDFSRVDFRVDENGIYYLLEVNTIPGMTELSLFPMACKKIGLEFKNLINMLLS